MTRVTKKATDAKTLREWVLRKYNDATTEEIKAARKKNYTHAAGCAAQACAYANVLLHLREKSGG